MKEETMGVEDTFRLTDRVLAAYAHRCSEEMDASVELYLLNFWVKELSVRDICDRVAVASSEIDDFCILLGWFDEHHLKGKQGWKLSDLRKITQLLAESILDSRGEAARKFMVQCVELEGEDKVMQTMEI